MGRKQAEKHRFSFVVCLELICLEDHRSYYLIFNYMFLTI